MQMQGSGKGLIGDGSLCKSKGGGVGCGIVWTNCPATTSTTMHDEWDSYAQEFSMMD
jgi:hypothetical protein